MHLRAGSALHGKEPAGAGQTSDDRWTLPGCRPHHDRQHRGAELAFWHSVGIDPFLLALVLWGLSGNYYAAVLVLREHASRRPQGVVWQEGLPTPGESGPANG